MPWDSGALELTTRPKAPNVLPLHTVAFPSNLDSLCSVELIGAL